MSSSKSEPAYRFKLYVAGHSPKSQRARANLERILSKHFDGDVSVEIIDLLEQPELAHSDQIVAVPTLVREYPNPRTQIVGDLADSQKVLQGLGGRILGD
jgi:circadian clock protein KaiB